MFVLAPLIQPVVANGTIETYEWSHIIHDFLNAAGHDAPATVMVCVVVYCGYKVFEKWFKWWTEQRESKLYGMRDNGEVVQHPNIVIDKVNEQFEKSNREFAQIEERLNIIEEEVRSCPQQCNLHDDTRNLMDETKNCVAAIKEVSTYYQSQQEAIKLLLNVMLQGEFIHRHEDDGKVIKIPTGMEALINVTRDNPKTLISTILGKKS